MGEEIEAGSAPLIIPAAACESLPSIWAKLGLDASFSFAKRTCGGVEGGGLSVEVEVEVEAEAEAEDVAAVALGPRERRAATPADSHERTKMQRS
jgi:hypothetical protein